jgi:hypothetical protein
MSSTAGDPRTALSTMTTYTLSIFTGTPADPETYTDLAKARDVAFGVAEELGLDIYITEHYGEAKNVIEIIEGFEG